MKYLYLELIKRTAPYKKFNNDSLNGINFTVLGNFDILSFVNNPIQQNKLDFESLSSMKNCYERRHATIIDDFGIGIDRQPMYLCTNNDEFTLLNSILLDSWSDFQLVLSLIQFDKNNYEIWNSVSSLINTTRTIIDHCSPSFKTAICCHFGECDVLIFSKVKKVKDAIDFLNNIWNINERDCLQGEVISTYSLPCLFHKLSNDEIETQVENLLNEHQVSVQYMINRTNCGIGDNNTSTYALFGDYDYMQYLSASSQDVKMLRDIITNEGVKLGSYKSSQIILGSPCSNEKLYNSAYDEKSEEEWKLNNKLLKNSFKNLMNAVKSCQYTSSLRTIESLCNTLVGMHNYCFLLKGSRLAEDVYWYTEPMFSNLINIINDMVEYFEHETEYIQSSTLSELDRQDHIDNVGELINRMLINFQDLVKELQHFYSILSLSSRSFTEMYGCSMRSANATTKLIGAYHGLLTTVFNLFREEDEIHEKIIVPSRDIQICQETLFKDFTPKHRVILYYMNFESLFDYPKAIFALLHEAGHTVGNRIRRKRAEHFIKVATKYTIDTFFLNYTEDRLDGFMNLVGNSSNNETFYSLLKKYPRFNDYKTIIDDLYERQYEFFSKIIRERYEYLIDSLDDDILYEQDKKSYRSSLIHRINAIIINTLLSIEDIDDVESTAELDNRIGFEENQREQVCNHFAKLIQKTMFTITIKLLNDIKTSEDTFDKKCNVLKPEYISLYDTAIEVYSHLTISKSSIDTADENNNIFVKHVNRKLLSTIGNGQIDIYTELDAIGDIFGDIYSDLFACYILDFKTPLDIEKYYSYLMDMTDLDKSKILSDAFAIRCLTIAMIILNKSLEEAIQFILEYLNNNYNCLSRLISRFSNIIDNIFHISWFEDIINYAKDCKFCILEHLESLKDVPSKFNDVKAIREFYLSEKDSAPDYMIKFWYANKGNGTI